jgi:hypothetical protein
MSELQRMREPCPVCGCILTESMDLVARWEAERDADPKGSHERLVARLHEKGLHGLGDRLDQMGEGISPVDELNNVYAHLRALVSASEVGDWKHAVQGLLPEGFES